MTLFLHFIAIKYFSRNEVKYVLDDLFLFLITQLRFDLYPQLYIGY